MTDASARRPMVIFALLCFTWGTTWLAIKVGVTEVPPLWFAATRFVVAGLLLLGFARLRGPWRMPTGAQFRGLLVMGALCIAICFGLIFWGEQYVDSGVAGVVVQGFVPIGLVGFAAALGREKVRTPAWIAVGLGVAGIVLIAFDSFGHELGRYFLLGLLAVAIGTLFYGFGSVLGGDLLKQMSAVTASGWENLLGGLMLLPVALLLEGDELTSTRWWTSDDAWLAWGYLVVFGSLIGFTCYTYLLNAWGPTRTSAYAFITPVLAFGVGWWLGDERFSPVVALGAAVVVVAVAVLWIDRRRAAAAAPLVVPDPAQKTNR